VGSCDGSEGVGICLAHSRGIIPNLLYLPHHNKQREPLVPSTSSPLYHTPTDNQLNTMDKFIENMDTTDLETIEALADDVRAYPLVRDCANRR